LQLFYFFFALSSSTFNPKIANNYSSLATYNLHSLSIVSTICILSQSISGI
jgi:hypothetical protein